MQTKETVAEPGRAPASEVPEARARSRVNLAPLTSIRIGGWAREFYEPGTPDELRRILAALRLRGERPFLLGGGTNTIFPDGEYPRPVISTRRLDRTRAEGTLIVAECGAPLGRLLKISVREGLSGLESLAGIPGTAGGAAVMNAGGGGANFGDRVEELGLLPLDGGEPFSVRGREVAWGYRATPLGSFAVLWVALRLAPDSPGAVRERVRRRIAAKRASQPLGERSAGCVFRNPPGLAAGRLIELAGLKGLSRGAVRVSERHANFVVNGEKVASAADFRSLLEEVRRRVARSFGVDLELEVVLA